MNDTIALPHLSGILASATGMAAGEAESFVVTFFAHLQDSLAVSESVTVAGLGRFIRNDDTDNPIDFIPDSKLAEALNRPFEMFEPVVIPQHPTADATTSTPVEVKAGADANTAMDEQPMATEEETDDAVTADDGPDTTDTTAAEENSITAVETESAENSSTGPAAAETETAENETEKNETASPKPRYALIFALGMIAGGVAGYFGHDKLAQAIGDNAVSVGTSVPVVVTDVEERDSVVALAVPIEEPVDTVVAPKAAVAITDTVTPQRFLTTMARQYYGQMEYWAFIYQANAEHLGHPNRIKPGTVVVIPDRSEFDSDGSGETTLEKAKRIGKEIYNRFD